MRESPCSDDETAVRTWWPFRSPRGDSVGGKGESDHGRRALRRRLLGDRRVRARCPAARLRRRGAPPSPTETTNADATQAPPPAPAAPAATTESQPAPPQPAPTPRGRACGEDDLRPTHRREARRLRRRGQDRGHACGDDARREHARPEGRGQARGPRTGFHHRACAGAGGSGSCSGGRSSCGDARRRVLRRPPSSS